MKIINWLIKLLSAQGILDKHYVQVEELEDKDNPHFAEEVMTMFFRDSTKLIATVEHALWVLLLDI